MDWEFLNHRKVSMVFFEVSSCLLYSVQLLNCKNCKRLRDFEEKEFSMQSCRGDCEKQGGTLS